MAKRVNLLTKAEAAEILRMSEWTVDRLIENGQLPAYRLAKTCVRIDEADLYEYIQSRKTRFEALRTMKVTGVKDLKQRERINALPCTYRPGMKVVDPRG